MIKGGFAKGAENEKSLGVTGITSEIVLLKMNIICSIIQSESLSTFQQKLYFTHSLKQGKHFQTCRCFQIVVPQNGWFTRENPIKIDDLEVPLFLETPM